MIEGVAVRILLAARRGALLALVAVGLASASCSLLVDSSGLAGDDAAEVAPSEAGDQRAINADAGADAAPDGATNPDGATGPRKNSCGALLFGTPIPLSNGDFEIGCANGWGAYQATVTEDTTTPSKGSIACRVCYTSGTFGFYVSSSVARPVVPGENYEVVACVRAVPGAMGDVTVHAELTASSDGISGTPVNAGATYVPVRAAWEVTTAHASFGIDVRALEAPGSCFLVDDVSLAIVRDAGTN